MTTRRSRLGLAATAPALLLLTACGPQSSVGSPPPAEVASLDADAVVLRIDYTGGYVPVETIPSRLPVVSIYGDGRVITQGPVTLIYPGPALPNLLQTVISAEDVQTLVKKAQDAGVGTAADVGQPPVADVQNTRFTLATPEGTKTLEVVALGMEDVGGLTDAQKTARKKLSDLVNELNDVRATLGADRVTEPETYSPTAIAAIATPHVAQPDPALPAQPAVAWPGPALPGDRLNASVDVGCVLAAGDEASKVIGAAQKANSDTPWESAGKRWKIAFRPLLPEETSCSDLAKQG
ncbi:hypothetical protein OG792_19635 [Micromonospora sp. NBC_01699]|uniref:hypothetical protein n=1 Tax=Micromonospora sp. NBC_01699 TaxID=2975984 RepID=UPI002E29CF8E|nr:hypothetical protein [Micromonospora sp. NBC_01699]